MTFDELKNVIVDTLNADEEKVTMEASLADDLQAVDFGGGVSVRFSPNAVFSSMHFPSGGAGMVGTAPELLRLLETIRTGGAPLTGPAIMNEMSRSQAGKLPGMPGMETPTGKFQVYLKYQIQTMRGTNLDGTPYVAPDIPWVTYFTGPIAFHGAPWRDSFGWSGPGGSHGCVNMTVGAAQFVYNWAPMGTVVVSHY